MYPNPPQNPPDEPAFRAVIAFGVVAVLFVAGTLGVVAGRMHMGSRPWPAVGDTFQHFSGMTTDRTFVDTEDFAGQIIVVDFWATWCGPCLQRMPEVKDFQRDFADRGVQVIGVSHDHERDTLAQFEEAYEKNFPTIFEGAQAISQAYEVQYLPTLLVVDRKGRIAYIGGGSGWRKIAERLAREG